MDVHAASIVVVRMLDGAKPQPAQIFKPMEFLPWVSKRLLLCGGVSSSGQSSADLSITKAGNTRLHTDLVELAWRLLLYQPKYTTDSMPTQRPENFPENGARPVQILGLPARLTAAPSEERSPEKTPWQLLRSRFSRE